MPKRSLCASCGKSVCNCSEHPSCSYNFENNDINDNNEMTVDNNLLSDNYFAKRMRKIRANESVDQYRSRLNKQNVIKERNCIVKQNNKPMKYSAQYTENVDLFYLGPMTVECSKCTALHFQADRLTDRNKTSFNDCCKHGKAIINEYPALPELLTNLFLKIDSRASNFFDNIRALNSNLAFASMNAKQFDFNKHNYNRGPWCFRVHGQIVHQTNIALLPGQGETPAFGQIYIYDTEQALNFLNKTNPNMNVTLQKDLYELIKNCHPFAECFEMMNDVIDEEQCTAAMEGRRPKEVNLI